MIIKVSTVSELDTLIANSKSLILDFYADWCGPCKNLGKFMENIKDNDEFKDVVFCKVDVDKSEFEDTCFKYEVSGIPHVVFFKNSKKVSTLVGFNESKFLDSMKLIL